LATIDFDGKGSLNPLASTGLSKDPNLIGKEERSQLPSDKKDIVHDLQDQAIIEDDELIKIPEVTVGQTNFSTSSQKPITLVVLEEKVKPMGCTGLTGVDQQVRPVLV
jgi:hypothetical protein